ncbi:hypothetical protein [Paenibacillus xylanexedens]|uniref:hypothetical protein n=1 Tax=Paenibacillus xylanexedens TaxID=528191 RepID=UPI0028EFBF3E|nr:hypothetical protein [Paenibacillus xylanexedens]
MTQVNADGRQRFVEYLPDECPVCHYTMEPNMVYSHSYVTSYFYLDLVFQCSRRLCNKLFISNYRNSEGENYRYYFQYSSPFEFEKKEFIEPITDLSANFVQIYNEALSAENGNLKEICGAGYRKSLEFLVKDYLIHKLPDREDEIKGKFLGACIEMISDQNIKFCAQRATWLGNDETHYIRKWEDHDLSDMKALIHLTVNWVTNELLMEKYRSDMA